MILGVLLTITCYHNTISYGVCNIDLQAVVPALSDWLCALRGAETEAEPARPNHDSTALIPGLATLRLRAVLDTLTHTLAVHLCSQEEWHNFMQHKSHAFLSYLSVSMQLSASKLLDPVFQEEKRTPMAVHAGFIALGRASKICGLHLRTILPSAVALLDVIMMLAIWAV